MSKRRLLPGSRPSYGTLEDGNGQVTHVRDRRVAVALEQAKAKLEEDAQQLVALVTKLEQVNAHWWIRLGRKLGLLRRLDGSA